MRLTGKPVLCNYYITYRCNASCSFCDIWEKPSPYSTLENVENNLVDLKKLGVKVIDFTGGEPLLHGEIELLLKKAKELGFVTTLTTNGLLYPKKAVKLHKLVDMLHFSLDYADAEKHDSSRGTACFSKILESIEVALSLGERPDILFTAFNNNIDEIEKVYTEVVVPNNLILILNPSFSYNGIGEELTEESLMTLQSWGKKKNVYLNNAFISLRRNGGNSILDPVCKAASTTLVISPENKLLLPCYHLSDSEIQIEGNLYTLWKSQQVQNIIKMEGRLPECEGCTINCYMQPSFAININKYFWKALGSTIKYNYLKGTWKQLEW